MNTTARIASVAIIAISSLLVGMRLSPQDAAKNANATERYEAAQLVLKQAAEARENGMQVSWARAAEVDTAALWSRRSADAAVDAGAMSARDAFAKHLERMETLMHLAKERFAAGQTSAMDVAVARFHVADAKTLLERAK